MSYSKQKWGPQLNILCSLGFIHVKAWASLKTKSATSRPSEACGFFYRIHFLRYLPTICNMKSKRIKNRRYILIHIQLLYHSFLFATSAQESSGNVTSGAYDKNRKHDASGLCAFFSCGDGGGCKPLERLRVLSSELGT